MDNAGVGVDLSGLQNSGSKLFTKAQKNRLLQSGLDIDEVLKGTVSANQANDLYKLSRELSLKYKKAGVNNAIDGAIGDQLKTFATQIRDKLDETASTVSKSFGLKQTTC
jgi:predicted metal-dependent phosphoesterase TrpH